MNQVPVLNFRDFIAAEAEVLTTDSRQIAAVFGKRHDAVIRDVRTLMAALPKDRLHNFVEASYEVETPNGGVATYPSFRITRDGFTWLAMRFRGQKALAFQVAYTDAFNAMAAYIKNQREGLQFQYLRKELEFKGRKSQVSGAAREMRKWQDEKPARQSEMDAMLAHMQPPLLPN